MTSKIFQQILEHIEKTNNNDAIILCNDRELPIDRTIFEDKFTTPKENAQIAFVDGGNAEIISAPNFSLQFIRVYASIFKNNKRIKNELHEFYVIAATATKNGKIIYETKTFNSEFDITHEFEIKDETIASGTHNASPAKIAETARKFAELKTAAELTKQLNQGDMMVCDGELFSQTTFEQQYLDELFSAARNKNITVCGFSKTTTLLTDAGNPATIVLGRLSEEIKKPVWAYFPSQQNEIKTGFLKLSPLTKYIFRADIYNSPSIMETASLLYNNSQDPAFIGYPYGLVDADLRSHISKKESQLLKLHFTTKTKDRLKIYSASIDSHDVLNLLH